MSYKYFWKNLTSDGLLKEPEDVGYSYNKIPINGYSGGFDTEEQAIDYFITLAIEHRSCINQLVLIKTYVI
jgi:hypothetical protein